MRTLYHRLYLFAEKCDLGGVLGEAQIGIVERHELFCATDEMRKL